MMSKERLNWCAAVLAVCVSLGLFVGTAEAGKGKSVISRGYEPPPSDATESKPLDPERLGKVYFSVRSEGGKKMSLSVYFESLAPEKWRDTDWEPPATSPEQTLSIGYRGPNTRPVYRGRLGERTGERTGERINKDRPMVQLVEGKWRVHVVPSWYSLYQGQKTFEVEAGKIQEVKLTPKELKTVPLTVRVTHPEDGKLDGGKVHFEIKNHHLRSRGYTINGGRSSAKILPGHRVELRIHPDFPYLDKTVTVGPVPEEGQTVEVSVAKREFIGWCSLAFDRRGKVTPVKPHKPTIKALGKPFVEVVSLDEEQDTHRSWYRNGRCEFWGLDPGKYKVNFLVYPRRDDRAYWECPPREEITFTVKEDRDKPMKLGRMVFYRWAPEKFPFTVALRDVPRKKGKKLKVVAKRQEPPGEKFVAKRIERAKFRFPKIVAGHYTLKIFLGDKKIKETTCPVRPAGPDVGIRISSDEDK